MLLFREQKIDDLKEWLKLLPTYKLDRQLCGNTVLEPDVVNEIQKTIDTFKTNKVKTVTMNIKPNFLYRVSICQEMV